jgi:type II secretory pathway predicted ATPase ExeA
MLTEVMRYYGLARPPIDAGFYETEHHAQVLRDVRAAILGGRLVALTAIIGSGKTILSRRLRAARTCRYSAGTASGRCSSSWS